MWAERFNKLNHENHRNTKRREDRLKEKQEQQKEKPEFDFDLGGPIWFVQTTEILRQRMGGKDAEGQGKKKATRWGIF